MIDNLDMTRYNQSTLIYNFVEQMLRENNRWRVVIAIRKYDLKFSHQIQELFKGLPPAKDFQDEDFPNIAHVLIPELTEDQLAQASAQSPQIKQLLAGATADLKELLRNPFNLRLVGDLLGDEILATSFSLVRTQLELLKKYWEYRVIQNVSSSSREATLNSIVRQMVKDRTLHLSYYQLLSDPTIVGNNSLDELKIINVLDRFSDESSGFSHSYLI